MSHKVLERKRSFLAGSHLPSDLNYNGSFGGKLVVSSFPRFGCCLMVIILAVQNSLI